jgi:hypothetical protein
VVPEIVAVPPAVAVTRKVATLPLIPVRLTPLELLQLTYSAGIVVTLESTADAVNVVPVVGDVVDKLMVRLLLLGAGLLVI